MSENNEPKVKRKKLSEFGEFDPNKPMTGPSRIVDVTDQVLDLDNLPEFDPTAPMKGPSRIVNVTADVLAGKKSFFGLIGASGVQIIGGVRNPVDDGK